MIVKPLKISVLPQQNDLVTSVILLIPIKSESQTNEQFEQLLETIYKKAAKQIIKVSGLKQHPFIPKLLEKVAEIKNNTRHAKSVVIYVATDEEQTYYFNYVLDTKIILNEKFSIITILKEHNRYLKHYLAVVLTGCYTSIYKASGKSLKKIAALARGACDNPLDGDMQQKCHISNNIMRKKQILTRYINTIDTTLHLFLDTQPLPVFVLGSHSVANYFSENSIYRFYIVEMFTTNYTDVNEEFISGLVDLWAKHQLEKPANHEVVEQTKA